VDLARCRPIRQQLDSIPTLWRGGTLVDLGTLGSPNKPKNSNVAWPVKNTRGLIVGISQTDSPDPWGENWSCFAFFVGPATTGRRCLGFVWEAGVMRPLPTLGGTHGYATAANNHGQIVGWTENTVRDPTWTPPQVFQFRAVVWGPQGNQIHELPVLPGDTSTAATAINDKGQIAGISGTCDDAVGSATAAHAVLWEDGTIVDIGNQPPLSTSRTLTRCRPTGLGRSEERVAKTPVSGRVSSSLG
jgi:probable HAF family extracellular repeat protein